ncbi:MAG: hypothetical protein QW303_01660 [Nitrososphaerota archaeon]
MLNYYKIDSSPVFERIVVDTLIHRKTVIYWTLKPSFADPLPYVYTIFFNKDFNDPDGWVKIFGPATNITTASIDNIRTTGNIIRYGFKIRLETGAGEYESEVKSNQGVLTRRQQLHYKTAIRRLTIVPRNVIPLKITLLKRKWFGPKCSCIIYESDEVTDSKCLKCFGTGIAGGYWNAGESRLIDISTEEYSDRLDPYLTVGQTGIRVVRGLIPGLPIPEVYDVVVRHDVDRRYYIRSTACRAEIAGLPLAVSLEMGVADFDDVIYKFEV